MKPNSRSKKRKKSNADMSEPQRQYAVMVERQQTPSVLHDDYDTAENEARRLCKHTGNTAYVLLAITKIEPEIKVTSLA